MAWTRESGRTIEGNRTVPGRRRTQAERRAATRGALLDAIIDLVGYGSAGLTTTQVVQRAGVSRGAIAMLRFVDEEADVERQWLEVRHRLRAMLTSQGDAVA